MAASQQELTNMFETLLHIIENGIDIPCLWKYNGRALTVDEIVAEGWEILKRRKTDGSSK